MTHYQTLRIDLKSDFKQIKKAYFKRAKECHPDRHNNSREKEEEFKQVVAAFDVLSDPEKRYQYDKSLSLDTGHLENQKTVHYFSEHSIMDTVADDILEELIVGNNVPRNASLMNLMLDLQKTEVFVNFREGKNLFYNKKFNQALNNFQKAIAFAPRNILYQCYLARTLAFKGKYSRAKYHYNLAIDIGNSRVPPQHLAQIRKELKAVKKQQLPWWHKLIGLFQEDDSEPFIVGSDEKMIEETNETMNRLLKEKRARDRKLLK